MKQTEAILNGKASFFEQSNKIVFLKEIILITAIFSDPLTKNLIFKKKKKEKRKEKKRTKK